MSKGALTQAFLNLQFFLQLDLMRNLLFLLDQVQAFRNNRVVLVLVFSDLHEDFNHILNPLTDPALVQDGAEAFKYCGIGLWRIFCEEGADFTGETDGNLDGVIGWPFKQKDKYLKSNNFMGNSLVD